MGTISINIDYWEKNGECLGIDIRMNGRDIGKGHRKELDKVLKKLGYVPENQAEEK